MSTPVLLPGGRPFDFYLYEQHQRLQFTDDGLTLFALRGLGYDLNGGRSCRGISNIATSCGFYLDENAIVAEFPSANLPLWGGKIMRLFNRILDWESEHFNSGDADLSLTEEVERLMRVLDPSRPIVREPQVKLPNGDDLRFDFRWGDQLIDTLAPTAGAVAYKLRKAIQFTREAGGTDGLLYIIDDRRPAAREAATRELSILGAVARAQRLSDFARAA